MFLLLPPSNIKTGHFADYGLLINFALTLVQLMQDYSATARYCIKRNNKLNKSKKDLHEGILGIYKL